MVERRPLSPALPHEGEGARNASLFNVYGSCNGIGTSPVLRQSDSIDGLVMGSDRPPAWTPTMDRSPRPGLTFERALRLAAVGHRDQVRKGSGVPYIEHPMAVALILDRAGFDEETVIAGLLHDLVEDTDVTLEQVREGFGDRVAEMVAYCSEEKLDSQARNRPW